MMIIIKKYTYDLLLQSMIMSNMMINTLKKFFMNRTSVQEKVHLHPSTCMYLKMLRIKKNNDFSLWCGVGGYIIMITIIIINLRRWFLTNSNVITTHTHSMIIRTRKKTICYDGFFLISFFFHNHLHPIIIIIIIIIAYQVCSIYFLSLCG